MVSRHCIFIVEVIPRDSVYSNGRALEELLSGDIRAAERKFDILRSAGGNLDEVVLLRVGIPLRNPPLRKRRRGIRRAFLAGTTDCQLHVSARGAQRLFCFGGVRTLLGLSYSMVYRRIPEYLILLKM